MIPPTFAWLFLMALISAWLCQIATDEIDTTLAGAIAVMTFFLGLAFSPWTVQLLILALLLFLDRLYLWGDRPASETIKSRN